MIKSFGNFEITETNVEKRRFKGIASTPSVDRVKDILIPEGAKFQLPVTLLFHHDQKQAIGQVVDAKVTSKGIEVEIEIPEVTETGIVKDRTDEAFHSLKYKLVKGLSVGFFPEWETAEMNKAGGVTFKSWEWYELSLVTIPCNPDATVDLSKQLKEFEQHRAALGNDSQKNASDSDISGTKHTVVKLNCPTSGGVKL